MTYTTGPTLALVPGTRTAPGTGASTGPRIHPELTDERVFAGLHNAGYHAWLGHVWHAAACTRPVRLRGDIRHIDTVTGELVRTVPTIGMPDGVIYKPCGNRRVTVCPGCAETYRRDAYHIIRAGLTGGKGITPSVAAHPAVFITFTAPSFGPVHSRSARQHTCTDKSRCRCRPQPCCPASFWMGMTATLWLGMSGDGKGPAGGFGGALWCPGCRGGGQVVAVSRSRG